MTDLEIMRRAKMYLDKLSQGIDPITEKEVPEDSVLNNVRLARCFFYVSDVLGRVIANDGMIGEKPRKQAFSITVDQLSRVRISQEPIRVTQLAELISDSIGSQQMKRLSTTTITNWLLEKGFLEKQTTPEGKSRRVPTPDGIKLGLFTQTRQGQYGEYQAVFYSPEAQQFVIDNLPDMLP